MSSIKKNFLYNVIYQLLLIVLPLITTPYISRVLGAHGIGVYTYTYTVANYFMLVAMLGVKNYGNRSIASVRDDKNIVSKTFWEIYGLQFLCSVVSISAYCGYIFLFESEYWLISLIQGIYVLSGLLDISWFFFGLEQFKITVFRNIVIRLCAIGCVFVFVKTAEDLWKYTLIMTLSVLISQGYLWFYVKRFIHWVPPKLVCVMGHFKSELILFIPVIAVSLYKMMDKIMLRQMSTFTQVGYYESAEKILNIPMGVITALGTVMLPRMSHLAQKGKMKESKQYIYNSMIFAMFLASGMLFGIAGIAKDFIPLFLGEEYMDSIVLLQALTPTVFFIAWANVIRTQYLIPRHMDKSYIISVLLGAVVNLVINALLIPKLEAMGAVLGTVCAEGSVFLCQTIMVRKELEINRYWKHGVVMLAMGAAMCGVIYMISPLYTNHVMALCMEILVGGLVYAISVGGYLMLTHKSLVKEQIGKFKSKKK